MSCSTVGATGGAMATAAWFAYAGTSCGPAGTLVGFGAGFVGYLIVDALVGESVEAGVRSAMGEPGCSGGVGPGR